MTEYRYPITPLDSLTFDNDECLYLFNDTISTLDNLILTFDLDL